jgi:HlyD family secretion protein/macrolide-specific efflux system membrane fusion protein
MTTLLLVKKMLKKKKTYVILVIILLVGYGIYAAKSQKTVPQFTTESATKGNLAQTVSVTGTIVSAGQIDLSFKSAGKIIDMEVKVGDKVTQGQKIAEIDKGTLPQQINQAKADIAFQTSTYDNMKSNKDTYTKDQRDAQSSNVDKSKAALAALQQQLKDAVITAPKDGVIAKKNFDLGETVAPNTAVVSLAGESDLEIESKVPESDIVKVVVGQHATVTLDAFSSDEKIDTEVAEIEPASTVIQDVVYYKVKLKLPSQDPRFRNGMSADIDIKTAERNNVVMAPLRAVKNENGHKVVEILKDAKTGLTEKVPVTIGLEGDDGIVEIKSGLVGGEKVVTLTK